MLFRSEASPQRRRHPHCRQARPPAAQLPGRIEIPIQTSTEIPIQMYEEIPVQHVEIPIQITPRGPAPVFRRNI